MEIAVKAGGHQQLFKLLGRLGQCIELALVLTGGNDIVPGTLRRGTGQNRGGDFRKAHFRHLLPQESDYLTAEENALMHLGITQIQKAVLKSYILTGVLGLGDLKRQRAGTFAQHGHFRHMHFQLAGSDLFIHRLRVTLYDLTGHGDDALLTNAFQQRVVVEHHLGHAVLVAQINKDHTAVIADGIYPPGQRNSLVQLVKGQLITVMGSVSHNS